MYTAVDELPSLEKKKPDQCEWLDPHETVGGVLVSRLRQVYRDVMKRPALFPSQSAEQAALLVMANDYEKNDD